MGTPLRSVQLCWDQAPVRGLCSLLMLEAHFPDLEAGRWRYVCVWGGGGWVGHTDKNATNKARLSSDAAEWQAPQTLAGLGTPAPVRPHPGSCLHQQLPKAGFVCLDDPCPHFTEPCPLEHHALKIGIQRAHSARV